MIKNRLEKDIWPIIFKALSDKKISYAMTPNSYPNNPEWKESHHHEIVFLLEDPNRPAAPGTAPPWDCWLALDKSTGNLHITMYLCVYLPRSIDIQSILAIMDSPRFDISPSLTLEDLPPAGPHYCLHFKRTLALFESELQAKIKTVDQIVNTLYIVETDPQNKKALEKLTELLFEI